MSLHERRGRLALLAWPRGTWTGRFYGRGNGRLTSKETRRGWTLRISLQAQADDHAAGVAAHAAPPVRAASRDRVGQRIRFRYDAATGVLRARFTLRNGTLEATR